MFDPVEIVEFVRSFSSDDCVVLSAIAKELEWSAAEMAVAWDYAAREGVDTLLDPVLAGVPVSDVVA